MSKEIRNNMLLLITAFIWGFAFVAQSVGMDYLGPYIFNAIRFFIGFLALLIIILIKDRKIIKENKVLFDKKTIISGGIVGLFLFLAATFQQIGIMKTEASKAGFITALYVIFVPIIGLFLHKKVGIKAWLCVIFSVIGLYFLCVTSTFTINSSDLYVFICAIFYSLQILAIDKFSKDVDPMKLSALQFFVTSFLSLILSIIFEDIDINAIYLARWSLLFTGLLSSAVAYTIQIYVQRTCNPVVSSIIMSLESVFACIGGMIILGERMNHREIIGAILIFSSVIISQISVKRKEENKIT